MEQRTYIIDFDSTFTQVEALDELARISLRDHPNKAHIFQQIEQLTNAAMEGRLSFSESLAERVKLLEANENDLKQLITRLKKKISRSFARNAKFFKAHAHQILIVSGGFKEFIIPVVTPFHIKKENIYANTFKTDATGKIVDYDRENPLSKEGGKVLLLQQLQLKGDLYGIGDGYSDFQLRESGMIRKFFAFTENIARENIVQSADHVTPSLDEFLYLNNLPRAISYPKNRILCLAVGDVSSETLNILKNDGFSVRHKATFEEKYIADVGMLVFGDGEKIAPETLRSAVKLKTLGYLGNSRNKVDAALCSELGIVVFDDSRNNKRNVQFIPLRMCDFMNTGATYLSLNFPNLQLPKIAASHRLIHIHKNVPGIMAQINAIYAAHDININAQFLITNNTLGYCITDINKGYDEEVLKGLRKIKGTIKFRILY